MWTFFIPSQRLVSEEYAIVTRSSFVPPLIHMGLDNARLMLLLINPVVFFPRPLLTLRFALIHLIIFHCIFCLPSRAMSSPPPVSCASCLIISQPVDIYRFDSVCGIHPVFFTPWKYCRESWFFWYLLFQFFWAFVQWVAVRFSTGLMKSLSLI